MYKKKLQCGQYAREQTVNNLLLDLLPNLFRREAIKQSLDKAHDLKFDIAYEQRCKENGVIPTVSFEKKQKEDLLPKKFDIELKIQLAPLRVIQQIEEQKTPISPKNQK